MPKPRRRGKRQTPDGLAEVVAKPLKDSGAFRTGKGRADPPGPSSTSPGGAPQRPVLDPPAGFKSKAEYEAFRNRLNEGLDRAGYKDAKAILQGSATTGHSPHKGTVFDGGKKPSDYDIAISSPSLMDAARRLDDPPVSLRSGKTRTGPLTDHDLDRLGLLSTRDDLERMAGGREVNFMGYTDSQTAVDRAYSPSVSMTPPYGEMPRSDG